MEPQVSQESVEKVVDGRLEPSPGALVLQELAQPLDGQGEIALDCLFDGAHEPQWQDLLEGAPRRQKAPGCPLEVVVHGRLEVLALHGAAEPVLDGGLHRRAPGRREDSSDGLVGDRFHQPVRTPAHGLLEPLRLQILAQLGQPELDGFVEDGLELLQERRGHQIPE
jgi:hypothetical protein